MSPEEILTELSTPSDRVPEAALREAFVRREALTEPLLDALLGFATRAKLGTPVEHDQDTLAVMAMYLLAQFREVRALQHFETLCRLPTASIDFWLGDMMTQDFPSFLASTCGAHPQSLQLLAEDPTLDLYARWAALDALLILIVEGDWSRDAMIAWLSEIWPRCRSTGGKADYTALVSVVGDLRAQSLLPLVRKAYAADEVDPYHDELSEIEEQCAESGPLFPDYLKNSRSYVNDPVERMSWHACYNEGEEPDSFEEDLLDDLLDDPNFQIQEPYLRLLPKVGRNDPCPCGSGKKYKKCCMQEKPPEHELAPRLK